jgi:hypothetical protein
MYIPIVFLYQYILYNFYKKIVNLAPVIDREKKEKGMKIWATIQISKQQADFVPTPEA